MIRTVAMFLVLSLAASPARTQTYLELAWFDRHRPDCFGFADPEARCVYDLRATIQLEIPPIAEWDWLRLLARSEVTANSYDPGEPGHLSPVKGDFGGGLVLRWEALSLTLLGSSRHCFDQRCVEGDTYNAVIFRWTEPR